MNSRNSQKTISVAFRLCFCVMQAKKAAHIFQDAEDATFSGKAVAWLASGDGFHVKEIVRAPTESIILLI